MTQRGPVKRSSAARTAPDTTRVCPDCVARDRWWVTLMHNTCPRCGAQYEDQDREAS